MSRSTSFGAIAADYDRLRPTPPIDAVRWLLPEPVEVAVDLGAGTGAMTRQLHSRAAEVIAVDPDDRMLAVLRSRSPEVRAVVGTAEATGLSAACADALVVSSAWHWINADDALPEIARVLRDGGRLGVIWNARDTTIDWVRDLAASVVGGEQAESEQRRRSRRALVVPAGLEFDPVEAREFEFSMTLSFDSAVETFGTYSGVLVMSDADRMAALDRARAAMLARFGDVSEVEMPMRSRAYRTRRLPRA